MEKQDLSILYPSQCFLGEGPVWHSQRKSFFWTDIYGGGFFEYSLKTNSAIFYESAYKVTLIVECVNEYLLLGVQGGLVKFYPDSKKFEWLLDIEKDIPNNRSNDGGCDSAGRLWIGTMDSQFKKGAGSLYCVDEKLELKKKIPDVSISNGIVWSLDNSRIYYIDTPTQKVQSYLFDETTGKIEFEKDIIHVPKEIGSPDGMTIDEEGMLWIAHWGGFGVYRWDPITGKQVGYIKLPVPNVSSCAFGGDRLHQLIITTAQQDLSAEDLGKYPHSGDLFVIEPGVRGIRANLCRL